MRCTDKCGIRTAFVQRAPGFAESEQGMPLFFVVFISFVLRPSEIEHFRTNCHAGQYILMVTLQCCPNDQTAGTMFRYPTQSHYSVTELSRLFPILVMTNVQLGNEKNKL